MRFTIFNCPLFTFSKNLDIIGYWVIGTGPRLKMTWNLAPNLQTVQKIPGNYCFCLYLSIDQVWWLNMLWFNRYTQKCTLSYVLILIMTSQIWQIMGWLKIQKLNYLENGMELFYEIKKFLTCASYYTFWENIVF